MPSSVDLTGLERLIARVKRLADPNPRPLMIAWMKIIEEDNRRGVLAGLDKDGNPMAPVTYRPKPAPRKLTANQRNKANPRSRAGIFAGFGASLAGANNNLTSAEYRRLDGPPLAPRRQFSRVITNLRLAFEEPAANSGRWVAYGAWDEVASAKGVKFLPFHFDGTGRLPKRDLRGVRPEGREKARKALIAWASDQIRMSA